MPDGDCFFESAFTEVALTSLLGEQTEEERNHYEDADYVRGYVDSEVGHCEVSGCLASAAL